MQRPPSFETEATNSTYQLTASEAVETVEAGLTWPETSAFMSRGCMQSFNLLALKLRPCIGDKREFLTSRILVSI